MPISLRFLNSVSVLLLAIAAMAVTLVVTATAAPAADAFVSLKGRWSGGGSASFAGGQTERLRCTARYSGSRDNLALTLKCASPSAQISLSGDLGAAGNRVSGHWRENSFGLSGNAAGSATARGVRLRISGDTTGFLTLNVAGNRHTVALSSQGTSLTGVNVTLRRR
jgi:hypothetical protein